MVAETLELICSQQTLETHWELLHQPQWAWDWICRVLIQVNPAMPLGMPCGL